VLLRVSSESRSEAVDLRAVTGGGALAGGVPGGEALCAFAEAAVAGDPSALAAARERVRAELGEAALVDAAGVIANFERMVRIADGTGIPLDRPVALVTADLRAELGIDAFEGSERTRPVRGLERVAGRLMSRMMPLVLRAFRRSR
jgi:hypothetical protein